jgi:hypothetical protein
MTTTMTREQQVAAYLTAHPRVDFCDDCLAAAIGINRHQARNATSGLGAGSDFDRGDRTCSVCRRPKRVIRKR